MREKNRRKKNQMYLCMDEKSLQLTKYQPAKTIQMNGTNKNKNENE